MAAAIIPIITSLLPMAAQVIPGIVQAIESLFPPKTGSQKMPAALDATKSALGQVIAAVTPGTVAMPDDATLKGMIEQEVQRMKAGLTPGTLPVVPDDCPYEFVRDWVLRLKVAAPPPLAAAIKVIG